MTILPIFFITTLTLLLQVQTAGSAFLPVSFSPSSLQRWKQRQSIQRVAESSINTDHDAETNNDADTEDCITIPIPQYYPHKSTPTHSNTYPSPLHNIHITPLLTPTQATHCLQIAKRHAATTSCWDQKDSQRHSVYPTADFAIDECDEMVEYLEDIEFDDMLWSVLGRKFDVDVDDLEFLDFFCVHYRAKSSTMSSIGSSRSGNGSDSQISLDNTKGEEFFMDRLDLHRDGSLLSFTIALSESGDYVDGGTIFDSLRGVVPEVEAETGSSMKEQNDQDQYGGVLCPNGAIRVKNPGDAVLHSGKILHGGNVVTEGERIVIVGFIDVHDRCMRDGVMKEACKEWGRCDVAEQRLERQTKKASRICISMDEHRNNDEGTDTKRTTIGWYRNATSKFLKQNSYMGNVVPSLETVKRRADKEYQRLKKLKAEDVMLRDILLQRNERKSKIPNDILAKFGGDVTVL